jgi:putative hydroxymethylpyrimidine transporter CytX
VEERTPSWGIEPVPERLRVLGLLDLTLLWGNLSVSLLVIVAAAGLVPMLSFRQALLAILIGSLAGSLLLALAAAIGADARVPGMVLLRAPLGRRGSYAPTVLNVAQNLGWSTFELIIISTAAGALSQRVFGFEARWLWALVFGAVSLALGLMGPIGFVRRYVRKFAVWAVAASIAYLTWWALDKANLHELWRTSGEGGLSLGQGVDLVLASVVSWTPLAADYTRFARGRRGAFVGAGIGYLLPTIWGFALGAVLVLERGLSDPAQIPNAVASGSVLAVIALLMLTVDESDEAFADVYSTAVSLQNLLPRASQRLLIVVVAATATAGAIAIDLGNYVTFLYLLGSVFVPLFGVLLADWLTRGAHYRTEDIFEAPLVRWKRLAAWVVGFALYQWLSPVGPSWWTGVVEHLSSGHARLTASLPSFAAAFGLTLLAAWIDSLRAAARSRREPLARPR